MKMDNEAWEAELVLPHVASESAPDFAPTADAPRAAGQLGLLGARRFFPLFAAQFLGAFNDQTYQKAFVALLTYRLADRLDMSLPMLGAIASALFILPFAVITPTAGQIADIVDKARMMRVVKFAEIVVMALAVLGFYTENVALLYVVLFLMGAQSAMFAPLKYAVLPQYLRRGELVAGNGLVQASTFIAIIFGAIAGNELILSEGGIALVSGVVLAVAGLGFVASLYTPAAPPLGPGERVDWLLPRAIWRLIARCRETPRAFRAVLFITWFWFLGATFLTLLPAYAHDALHADETVLTILLTAFSVGVAAGALASDRLNGGRVGYASAPLGALGIGALAVELWFATAQMPSPAAALHDRASFFASFTGWRIVLDFLALAVFAGAYVTPLNAVLQTEAPEAARARFIACSSVLDSLSMTVAAGLVAALAAAGLRAEDILALFALSALPVALAVSRHAPQSRLGGWVRARRSGARGE